MEVVMNTKWMRLGVVATALALAGAVALNAPAFAQGGAPADGPRGGGMGQGLGQRGGAENSLIVIAADVLGLEQADLVADLRAGQTIAEVAEAQGVALDTLVDAVMVERSAWLNQAVAAGRLTQAQADARLATMRATVLAGLTAPHTPNALGPGNGTGFVDADGDGVCDTGGGTGPGASRGRRGGR